MLFNGSNAGEQIDLSANGNRLRLHRDVGNVTMDTDGVENVDVNALGSADTVTVDDLSGTDVDDVTANLASSAGSGDGAADDVVVNGTEHRDVIKASGSAGSAARDRPSDHGGGHRRRDPGRHADDQRARGERHTSTRSGLAADAIGLTIDGGDGDDRLTGGDGDDLLIGGAGQRHPGRRAGQQHAHPVRARVPARGRLPAPETASRATGRRAVRLRPTAARAPARTRQACGLASISRLLDSPACPRRRASVSCTPASSCS